MNPMVITSHELADQPDYDSDSRCNTMLRSARRRERPQARNIHVGFTIAVEQHRRNVGDVSEHPELDLPEDLRNCGLRHLLLNVSKLVRAGAHRIDVLDPIASQIDSAHFPDALLVRIAARPEEKRVFAAIERLSAYQEVISGRRARSPKAYRRELDGLTGAEIAELRAAIDNLPLLHQEARRILRVLRARVAGNKELRARLVSARGECQPQARW